MSAELITLLKKREIEIEKELKSIKDLINLYENIENEEIKHNNQSSIDSINNLSKKFDNIPDDYKLLWTWEDKIKYFISKDNVPLSTTEIANNICSFEPYRKRNQVVGSISAVLSQKSSGENPIFLRTENERKTFLYILNKDYDPNNTKII